MVYIFFGAMTFLVLMATISDSIVIGTNSGNVFKNAPVVLTNYTIILSLFGLMIAAAFFNNAALREHINGFNEILFSTPVSKAAFFFGRFLGALFLSTLPLLGIFLGAILANVIGVTGGWNEASRYGSWHLETFINNYFLFILPNMFVAGVLIFGLATWSKNTIVSFLAVPVILIAYFVSGSLLSDMSNETLSGMLDLFGRRAYSLQVKYYTPLEQNTLSPIFTGVLLLNRVFWLVVGGTLLMVSYFTFSFRKNSSKGKKSIAKPSVKAEEIAAPVLQAQDLQTNSWLQFVSFFRLNFTSILKSISFKILFLLGAIMLISSLMGGYESFGLKSYPLTYKIIDTITNSSTLFIMIILVFFSGELVWRDRMQKISEVIDATPHTSFVSLIAKALSLTFIVTLFHFFFVFCGIVYQLLNGYTNIELGLYFQDYLYNQLPMFLIFSGFNILIQVLLHHRYLAYFVAILVQVLWEFLMSLFDIDSNLLNIGGGPSLRYSDINQFGPGLTGALWFNAYWMLFSVLCLLVAGALWNRGTVSAIKARILQANTQLPGGYRKVMMATLGLWIIVGGFIFYNTHVLNSYQSGDEMEQLAIDYEQNYKRFEHKPLPKLTDIRYFIDIFPYDRDVKVKATIELTNTHSVAIDSLHFTINPEWEPEFEIPNAELVLDDQDLGYVIYALKEALVPGASLTIDIKTKYITQGFENNRGSTSIVRNGTFLNNAEILPSLGYQPRRELSDKNDRKKNDLLPKERMPALETNCSAHCMSNYLSRGHSDFINVETVISTASDQVAIAPGSLLKNWEENGRNYYHYKVDHPSLNFYSFVSAKYEIAVRKWNGIDIEIYYDAKHAINVTKMQDAVERSLAYYTKNFGPYFHKQCRIIEFPRYASFAQAFPGTMPYSESIGFIYNLEDETENSIVDAVVAHEMAHQWWAHQLIGANMQGGTMLSESFAEYSSLMTMKSIAPNAMKMRKFLKYDHDRYLRGRSREEENERPLYLVENQNHIHYGKGSVILFALQDYIGEDVMNKALRGFLETYRYKPPPYPTSQDFINHLEPLVPDSLNYLITDWLKEITLYDNRMLAASYQELPNGNYEVTMKVKASKIKADTLGGETVVPVNDWIDIGVFADKDEEVLVYEKRMKMNQPEMTFTFEVDTLPVMAAIDPRNLLIDRIFRDNVKEIKAEE